MSPLVGVVAETGDVLAIRARGGNASPKRKLASFIDECVAAIPKEARPLYQLWIRIDSAGFSKNVVDACVRHEATFTITAEHNAAVRAAICALAMDTSTTWAPAIDADGELCGSEVAETTYHFAARDLRLVVRRQQKAPGEQLRLLAETEAAGSKLIVVGDHRQLGAVGPGGSLGALVKRHGGSVHALRENVRQADPDERRVLAQLRAGNVEQAVNWYTEHDRIATPPTGIRRSSRPSPPGPTTSQKGDSRR